jgi:hypothetical protein
MHEIEKRFLTFRGSLSMIEDVRMNRKIRVKGDKG